MSWKDTIGRRRRDEEVVDPEVFDQFVEQEDTREPLSNIIVDALAGTGKTFTLVLSLCWMYRDRLWKKAVKELGFEPTPSPQQQAVWDSLCERPLQNLTYLAFNRSIVEEFASKYKWLVQELARINVTLAFATTHQLGFRTVCKRWGLSFRDIDARRTLALLEEHLDQDIREVQKERWEFVKGVEDLVSYCKQTLAGIPREVLDLWSEGTGPDFDALEPMPEVLEELVVHYGIELNGSKDEVFATVPIILRMSAAMEDEKCDFNDQIWLPIIHGLKLPYDEARLVDEAQDLNRCRQELCLKNVGRVVLCGDVNQAIYGFAGADVDSIPRMADLLERRPGGVVRLPLTVTRRCAKAVVEEAKFLVPTFEAHESNQQGRISEMPDGEQTDNVFAPGDMILCRVNAPLLSKAFRLMKAGKKVHFQGRDLGGGLRGLIKKSRRRSVGDLLEWLDSYLDKEMERLRKRKRPSDDAMVALQDKVDCLRVFCDGAFTIDDVYKNIDVLFPRGGGRRKEDSSAGKILLSSVHRAKGLEARRVFILKPELMPHPMAKSDWARNQEQNLRYVAITRAIEELVWVR